MRQRYILLFLIPAFFTLSSCATQHKNVEGFLNFNSDNKISAKPSKIAENIEKPVTKNGMDTIEKPDVARTYPVKRYHLGYLAFDVADIYGEFTEINKHKDYSEYRFKFYSHTNGFVNYLFGWMNYTVATMKVYKNKVIPEKFQTKSILKKKSREIEISYNELGQIANENVTPPDNRYKRPAVEDKLKANVYDPLSIAIEARRIVMKAFEDNYFKDKSSYKFDLALYDGRRRSDVKFELFKNKVNNYYRLRFVQVAIAGYTENEWKDIKKGEKSIDLYIDPKDFWPVIADGKSPIGSARAKFVEDCKKAFEDCIKRKED